MKEIDQFFYREDIATPSSWHDMTMNLLHQHYGHHTVYHNSISALMQLKKAQRSKNSKPEFNGEAILGENNFLNFLSFLQEHTISDRFQIVFFFKPYAHGVAFDLRYDVTTEKFKILCFDSAREILQYNILQLLTEHLKKNNIQYEILACQGNIQKNDFFHCALFGYILLRETSKYPDIFEHLNTQNIICDMPSFQVSNTKLESRPSLTNVKWIPTKLMPKKVITAWQSFTEMRENLPPESADKTIQEHRTKFKLDKYNTYIEHKRRQYGDRFISIGNQLFNFENAIEKHNTNEVSKEINLYFSERHANLLLDMLNEFTANLFNYFGFFTNNSQWFISTLDENETSINLIYKPEYSTEILLLEQFLKQYGLSCEANHQYQMIKFKFTDKKSEMNSLKLLKQSNYSLMDKFLNEAFFLDGEPAKIKDYCAELFLKNKISLLLRLFDYCKQKNKPIHCTVIEEIILKNLNNKFAEGESWLHCAVKNNCPHAIALLLKHQQNIYACNDAKLTALQVAVNQADAQLVEVLLNNGCSANQANEYGLLPIHSIKYSMSDYYHAQKNMFQLLLKHTNLNLDSLHKLLVLAIEENNTEIMEFCLNYNCSNGHLDIHRKMTDLANGTYLHLAASHNNTNALKLLLAHGAQSEMRDDNNKTPLDLIKYEFVKKPYLEYLNNNSTKISLF